MKDFDIYFLIYSTHFWNKLTMDENPSIKENLQYNPDFVLVRAGFLFQRRGFGFLLT
jgi:hypothetical protein